MIRQRTGFKGSELYNIFTPMKAARTIFLVLLFSSALQAQTMMMGLNAGIGGSKLAPRPTSPYLQYERFPALVFGTGLEYLTKDSPISGKLGFWLEFGGEKENPVGTITIPLMVKATFGKIWRGYIQGGLAGCYVYERSRRYQTSDFSSIYGLGGEYEFENGNYLFVEYIHIAGISSLYDEEMNVVSSGTVKLIENFHLRQYLNFGIKFYLGGRPVYYKRNLRTQ